MQYIAWKLKLTEEQIQNFWMKVCDHFDGGNGTIINFYDEIDLGDPVLNNILSKFIEYFGPDAEYVRCW